MAVIANRRAAMMLFSGASDMYSHRVRIVLAEKGIEFDLVDVRPGEQMEDLIELNPYNEVPTLVDRDLALYDSTIIMEYLDERFPHPPLMPVDPVSCASHRLMLYRIQRDLYAHADVVLHGTEKQATKARKDLRDKLIASLPAFAARPFFLSDEFSLVDCALLPLLWRLPLLGVELPRQATALNAYTDRLFRRGAFKASLSEAEKEMR
jgi:RNA polymerase-associated protein